MSNSVKWLALLGCLAIPAHAEDTCLSNSSPLAIYSTCAAPGAGCDEMSDLDGKQFLVKRDSRVGLTVERAIAIYDMFKSSVEIRYDTHSRACLHDFTSANVKKIVAFVAGNQILLAPTVMEPIDNPRSSLALGMDSTYRKAVELCLLIRPDCIHENVTWVMFKDRIRRLYKKYYDQFMGKNRSVMDHVN